MTAPAICRQRPVLELVQEPCMSVSLVLMLFALPQELAAADCCYYRRTPVSTGNTFQDLPRLRQTADNIESYIQGYS